MDIKNDYIKVNFPPNFDITKYENKKIIIVGAGPTTNDVNWENLDYDFIFSCNQYYLCDKIKSKQVDFVSIIHRMNFLDESLQDRLDSDNSFIGIEPHHTSQIYNSDKFKKFLGKYKDKCVFYDTKLQNKSGVAPRLALFSLCLKPESIYMVGIDGSSEKCKAIHSFEKGLHGFRDKWGYKLTNKSYIDFSKHIYEISKKMNIKLFNLGENHEDNMMSVHSKNNYPLDEYIKERLGL